MEGDKLYCFKTCRLPGTIPDPADKKSLKEKIRVETKIILFMIPMLVVPAESRILTYGLTGHFSKDNPTCQYLPTIQSSQSNKKTLNLAIFSESWTKKHWILRDYTPF